MNRLILNLKKFFASKSLVMATNSANEYVSLWILHEPTVPAAVKNLKK